MTASSRNLPDLLDSSSSSELYWVRLVRFFQVCQSRTKPELLILVGATGQ